MKLFLVLSPLLAAACTPTAPVQAPRDTAGPSDTADPTDTAEPADSADPIDADHDGYPASEDCDDADATVNPGQDERWYDGIDQDCDGNDDDRDGDGYPQAEDVNDLNETCHEDQVVEGWVEIANDAEAAAVCAGVCSLVVRGSVFVEGLSDAADLSCLTAISGDLQVIDSSVTSLDAFRSLNTVNRMTVADNPNLGSLQGLSSLYDVREELVVRNNEALTSLAGLEFLLFAPGRVDITGNGSLSSLSDLPVEIFEAEYIRIQDNVLTSLQGFDGVITLYGLSLSDPVLSDIEALASVRYVYGLSLIDLPNVTSLEPLSGVIGIKESLTIRSVGACDLEPLSAMGYIAEDLTIADVPLADMTGLEGIRGVDTLIVYDMPQLTSFIGFDSLAEVTDSVAIHTNPALISMGGFDALEMVVEQFDIQLNPVLVSLQGLEQLRSSGGLWIEGNDSLASLQGLSAVTSVGGYGLTVMENGNLTSLHGLEVLEVVDGDVQIIRNTTLATLESLSSLRSIGRTLRITDNAALS